MWFLFCFSLKKRARAKRQKSKQETIDAEVTKTKKTLQKLIEEEFVETGNVREF